MFYLASHISYLVSLGAVFTAPVIYQLVNGFVVCIHGAVAAVAAAVGIAADLGTGKEQKIVITASTNLSQDDIEKAVKEAEQYAAEDAARKDEVDTHNNAEHIIYQTEKTLGELGDKISDSEKASIQSAVDNLKEVNKGTDVAAIKAATEKVQKAFYAVSEKLYQQAGAQGGCDPSCGGNCVNDGPVDADYETVD